MIVKLLDLKFVNFEKKWKKFIRKVFKFMHIIYNRVLIIVCTCNTLKFFTIFKTFKTLGLDSLTDKMINTKFLSVFHETFTKYYKINWNHSTKIKVQSIFTEMCTSFVNIFWVRKCQW